MLYLLWILGTVSLAGVIVFLPLAKFAHKAEDGSAIFMDALMRIALLIFCIPIFIYVLYLCTSRMGRISYVLADSGASTYFKQIPSGWPMFWETLSQRGRYGFCALAVVWCGGVVWRILRGIRLNWLMKKAFSRKMGTVEYGSADIEEAYRRFRSWTGRSVRLPVLQSAVLDTPVLYGIRRPSIILDRQPYGQAELNLIIMHELTHYRRKDLWFQSLAGLVSTVYWFHPVIRDFVRLFYDYCEFSCDELVLKGLNKKERLLYAQMVGKKKNSFVSGFSAEALKSSSESIILKRLRRICDTSRRKRSPMPLVAAIFTGVACPLLIFSTANVSLASGEWATAMLRRLHPSIAEEMPVQIKNAHFTEYLTAQKQGKTETEQKALADVENAVLVEADVSGNSSYETEAYKLKKDDYVQINLSADSENGNFTVQFIRKDGKVRNVSSINGFIAHKFKVTFPGEYRLALTGKGDKKVHVVGSIYIKE